MNTALLMVAGQGVLMIDIAPRNPLVLNLLWYVMGFFTPILFDLLFFTVHYA